MLRALGLAAPVTILIAAGCATAPVPAPVGPMTSSTATAARAVQPKEVHWFRNSAEMRGIYLEVYRTASERLEKLAAGNAPQTWAVILDADETTIDNSTFEMENAGIPFSEAAWLKWVNRQAATPLPGAVEFTRLVQRLGGRVIIVSNRDNRFCDISLENIRRDSIPADLLLCRTTTGDKNPRFESVAKGTASPSLPPLKVLMWVGDNIEDFPGLSQSVRGGPDAGYANFGKTWFLVPNPMYGSWEKVPYK